MAEQVKVVFASGSPELARALAERMKAIEPGLPLYVVSEFPPAEGAWVPYHVRRTFGDNFARCRAALAGKRIRWAAVLLDPRMPHARMRSMPFLLAPLRTLVFNENLDHYSLRPRSIPAIARHFWWRSKSYVRWQIHPGGDVYTFLWRVAHPAAFARPVYYMLARAVGWALAGWKALARAHADPLPSRGLHAGISVVIPSRNGQNLLRRLLPELERQLHDISAEIIVVDNGSDDGTAEFLASEHPRVALEHHAAALSFAAAVNRGIERARYANVCLLNNDMELEPGFFAPLQRAFVDVPDLFCATAQIFFPPGERRQETGKAVMPAREPESRATDFPLRCDDPLEGESLSYVLYGSGGCSMYSTEKLRALGGFGEIFAPAYVEDLDAGYRGWLRGWPSVFVAEARVVHHHRATTSRYYSDDALARITETNYLRFLVHSVASARVFRRLWKEALWRLNLMGAGHDPSPVARAALRSAIGAWRFTAPALPAHADEELILALGSGAVAVFPGKQAGGRPRVLVASCYVPFPLSHGGAVRMYNLMRRAAQSYDQVLVAFVDELRTPPQELLEICVEVVLVRRPGSHYRSSTTLPDVVEEFASPAFRAALCQTVRKWRPELAQLEFTQMAQYGRDCAPARTLLIEHDITFDLFQQLLAQSGRDWELERQLRRWLEFERQAWRDVDCVVTMSEKDRKLVAGAAAVCIPNGVDLARFEPTATPPERARLLFIGSFAHLPNVLAMAFFLREVWPRLAALSPALHVIAGARHRYYLDFYNDRARLDLDGAGIEVEDFVADVRPAYTRATVVIAPLVASAGTNVKILEAMAMGKAIVSTPAGVNGLEVEPGADVLLAETGEEMAQAIASLLADPARRSAIEQRARRTVENKYGWDVIAGAQDKLYESLRARTE